VRDTFFYASLFICITLSMIDIYLKCSVKEESRARIGDISDQEGVRAPFEQRERKPSIPGMDS
jgi:hypothetical protein